MARIFDARTEPEGEATILRAWAYMLRGELADPLIANIEAGIHREVSVGCAMGKTVCSICGEPYGSCEHRKGKVYGGKTCYGVLCDPVDAYEFSFVAVPAQRDAGVMKAFGEEDELEALKKSAALGERYLLGLRREGVRLALSLGLELEKPILTRMAEVLDEEELLCLNRALQTLWDRKYACTTQLPGAKDKDFDFGTEYLI